VGQPAQAHLLVLGLVDIASPCRCRLDGEALQGLVVGQPARLTLAARDRFGNACAAGGEDVDVELRGPTGALVTRTKVPKLLSPYGFCRACTHAWIHHAPERPSQVEGRLCPHAKLLLPHQATRPLAQRRACIWCCADPGGPFTPRCRLLEGDDIRQRQWHLRCSLQGRPCRSLGHSAQVSIADLLFALQM